MLCDVCEKREAVVYITKIENGRRTEIHLCAHCARKEGQLGALRELNIIDNDFFRKMAYPAYEGDDGPEPVCPACGLTYSEFNVSGSLAARSVMKPLKKKFRRLCGVFTGTASTLAKCLIAVQVSFGRLRKSSGSASICSS